MSVEKWWAKSLIDYDSPNSLGAKFRSKRSRPLLRLLEMVSREHGEVRVIDVGGTRQYWNIVRQDYLERLRVKIVIVNMPSAPLPPDDGPFEFVSADGCDLSRFRDNEFHIAHSNSVVEHVGDWARMVAFSGELKRVAERYFVQTPNYWFPIEPHCMTPFFHWLPLTTKIWMVMNFSLGNWERSRTVSDAVRMTEAARLLNKKMFQALFDDGVVRTEMVLGLPKSFVAIRE